MNALAGPLLLVGSGKMGTALLGGWLDRGLSADDVLVVEPADAGREAVSALGVETVPNPEAIAAGHAFRAVVFAVKPQMMADVLPAYRDVVAKGAMVISIAAGTVIDRFEHMFGENTAVVRAMPNTPAAIGQGATALFANAMVDDHQRALAEALMVAVGDVHWLASEEQMHAVTAMSGGGPAYVFLLIETLAKAGIAAGLPEALAWPMARTTVIGSGALAAASEEPA
ncbi:MAG: pyrroline-5-carboxylate reductase family protein, partial [Geminicoccaceae bacterium]